MKQFLNGEIIDVDADIADTQDFLPYEQRVAARIREVYSVDDELAILRQRETKPDEFAEYFAFAEKMKVEEKERGV